MAFCDLVDIDERTVLVLGQELDVEHDQPDVANCLVHRVGETVFIVDTGVTVPFREAIGRAVHRVGPWRRVVVVTTHGHVDHVGNNDLGDELAAAAGGAAVEHYVPARDLPQLLDPESYWIESFARIAGAIPLPAPPKLVGAKVVSLFQPLHPFGTTTQTYEQRPLEQVRVGSLRLTGWTFADGAVRVVRSQGHCAGHVVVHLRDNGVLHLGDEGNGACGVMQDADQLKIQTTLGAVATMIDEGQVTILTDGHTFAVRDAAQAAADLDQLLDQAVALQRSTLAGVDDEREIRSSTFVQHEREAVAALGVGGANPNDMFTAMMAVNQLREVGLRPTGTGMDPTWSRPELVAPQPPPPMPTGLALVPAAAAMVRWKLGRHDR